MEIMNNHHRLCVIDKLMVNPISYRALLICFLLFAAVFVFTAFADSEFNNSDFDAPKFDDLAETPLTLHKVFYIDGPNNFQPSGLTIFNDSLYTICDKHDSFIYRLKLQNSDLQNGIAAAIPEINLKLPLFSFLYSYDFEGITCDETGTFFLASETHSRILKIAADGKKTVWITPDLQPAGQKAGLMVDYNAGLEGICRLAENKFIVCAERQDRGFLEIDLTSVPAFVRAYPSEQSKFKFTRGIRKDFSGLYFYKNTVYVLQRNAFIITKFKRDKNNYLVETDGWSYRHIETMPSYRYADMTYGKAEGLCIDDQYVYIIIDNNGDHRAGHPGDRRPLLMVFERPENL